MSFSLHSSTENFGGGRRSSSSGSNSSSSCSVSLKSLIGRMSRNVSARPWFRNHSKLLALDGDEIGQVERLREVGERVTLTGRRARGHADSSVCWCGWGGDGSRGAVERASMFGRTDTKPTAWPILSAGPRGVNRCGSCRAGPRRVGERVRVAGLTVKRSGRRDRPQAEPAELELDYLTSTTGAGGLELGLGLLGVVLADLLEHRLGRGVDQVLGLLEAEVGELAHHLDDLDLLVAGGGQDDVELVLLLRGLAGAAPAPAPAAATATGAAAVTPNFSSNADSSSDSSSTVMLEMASRMSSLVRVAIGVTPLPGPGQPRCRWCRRRPPRGRAPRRGLRRRPRGRRRRRGLVRRPGLRSPGLRSAGASVAGSSVAGSRGRGLRVRRRWSMRAWQAVGEVAGQGLQQAGQLDHRGLEGSGQLGQQDSRGGRSASASTSLGGDDLVAEQAALHHQGRVGPGVVAQRLGHRGRRRRGRR